MRAEEGVEEGVAEADDSSDGSSDAGALADALGSGVDAGSLPDAVAVAMGSVDALERSSARPVSVGSSLPEVLGGADTCSVAAELAVSLAEMSGVALSDAVADAECDEDADAACVALGVADALAV